MTNFIASPDAWLLFFRFGFLVFVIICTALGLAALAWGAFTAARRAVSSYYGLQAIFEVARELYRQGKTPKLKRWVDFGSKHGL